MPRAGPDGLYMFRGAPGSTLREAVSAICGMLALLLCLTLASPQHGPDAGSTLERASLTLPDGTADEDRTSVEPVDPPDASFGHSNCSPLLNCQIGWPVFDFAPPRDGAPAAGRARGPPAALV